MAAKRSKDRQVYWQDAVKRQSISGLSIREFCEREGVSEPSFYLWRKRVRPGTDEEGPRTTDTAGSDTRISGKFIPLKLLDPTSELEVIHPLGYRIRLSGEINATELRRVLDVLDERSRG